MTDIVARLRAEDGWVCNEGADEIERQRGEITSLKASCGYEAANQLTADNERLRAAVEQALDDMGEQGLSVCQQAKEMLQAALETKP